MFQIEKKIQKLPTVTLSAIDQLTFMDRTETKFVFPVHQLEDILSHLDDTYKILTIKNKIVFQYRSTYFDTSNHRLFIIHQNGKLNRYKIRYREYIDTRTAFLEIKKKSNKQKTLKSRIPYKYENKFDQPGTEFLETNTTIPVNQLVPALVTHFERVTLVSFEHKERITLDFNLSYSCFNGKVPVELPFLGIAEVKSEGNGHKSNFIRYLKTLRIYPSGMSKYCMGVGLMQLHSKTNRMKPKILQIEKIKHEYGTFTKLYA